MFSFFTKKKSNEHIPEYLPLTLDIHSHILPGIDDGSPDIETSLELLQGLYNLGIRKSVATPHVIGDMYRNTSETIMEALSKIQKACQSANINIELSAAAEYMLDDYFIELLQKKTGLLTLHKNIILTEISYSATPQNLDEIVEAIGKQGYLPVLAHPERYHFYQNNFDKYYRLVEMGFVLQVNILSLVGYYGKKAEKAAKFLIDKELVKLAGTDLHHHKHLAALNTPENRIVFDKYLKGKNFNDLDAIALKI